MIGFAISVEGQHELDKALAYFQRGLRKDFMNALHFAAYNTMRGLVKRTKEAKKGPKVRLGTQADFDVLAALMPVSKHWQGSPEEWRQFVRTQEGAYIVESDRPRDRGFRELNFWRRDRYQKAALKERFAYRKRGMAKASWRWLAGRTRKNGRGGNMGNLDAKSQAYVQSKCPVHVDRANLAIVIENKLGYIRAALKSASSVDDSIRAASKAMMHYVDDQIKKRKAKAKL